MNSPIITKHNRFIFYPDLSNKFILTSLNDIISPNLYNINLKYIFSGQVQYSFIALKALLMLSSCFPKRCLMGSKMIILKYTKNRLHSFIFIPLSLMEYIHTLKYFIKSPSQITSCIKGHLKESKHFIFPGFIKPLKLPHWDYTVTISYHQSAPLYLYYLFFCKTAYLD